MTALSVFTGVVYVFLVLGSLWVVGMIVEHFIEEILL
jgi:heme/copper-type cytochrome/quinol oxidase subunit 4